MAIAYDNSTGASTVTSSSLTFSHTINDNTNGIIWVFCGTKQSSPAVPSGVTFAGNAMTKINGGVGADSSGSLWYYIGPAAGANNVIITMGSSNSEINGIASSYTGVAQTTPEAQASGGQFDNSPSSHQITTIAANAWCISAMQCQAKGGIAPQNGQTERQDVSNTVSEAELADLLVVTPGLTTLGYTFPFAREQWNFASMAPAVAGGSTQPPRSMHQFRQHHKLRSEHDARLYFESQKKTYRPADRLAQKFLKNQQELRRAA